MQTMVNMNTISDEEMLKILDKVLKKLATI